MSFYQVSNPTNGRSSTLANTFAPGAVTIPGYTQGGASITFSPISSTTIESATTGYQSSGTDIGNSFCAKYNGYAGPTTGSIPVSNYSSCTIVMIGGGGGGGGSTTALSPASPTTAGSGGDGGITIIRNIPLSSATTISYTVGSAGTGGGGSNNIVPRRAATVGNAGNATTVNVSGTTYSANGGSGGPTQSPASGNGSNGTITPTTQNFTTATLNGALTYNATNRVINFSSTNYGQGGAGGGSGSSLVGGAGTAGTAGYLRIYLYP